MVVSADAVAPVQPRSMGGGPGSDSGSVRSSGQMSFKRGAVQGSGRVNSGGGGSGRGASAYSPDSRDSPDRMSAGSGRGGRN